MRMHRKGALFLKLVGDTGKIIAQFPDITLQSMIYEDKKLKLIVQSNKIETINGCLQELRTQGFLVNQQISKTAANNVTAFIDIEEHVS